MFHLFCWPKAGPAIRGREVQNLKERRQSGRNDDKTPKEPPHHIPQPAFYRRVRRESCRLLQHCWEQKWEHVLKRIQRYPNEAFCVTQDHGRSALHLATVGICPLSVAKALITVNPHMITLLDKHGMTPLHHICQIRGDDDLIPLVCQKLLEECRPGGPTTSSTTAARPSDMMFPDKNQPQPLPPPSPLWYAARRGASLRVLQTLLATSRQRGHFWIAPRTGGESCLHANKNDATASDFSVSGRSPLLEIMFKYQRIIFLLENDPKTTTGDTRLQTILKELSWKRLSKQQPKSKTSSNEEKDNKERIEIAVSATLATSSASNGEAEIVMAGATSTTQNENTLESFRLEVVEFWEKCLELLADHCLLLPEVTDEQGQDTMLDYGVLHAVVCANLPSLLPLVVWLYPEQLLQHDEHGCLPLHYAIQMVETMDDCSMISTLLRHCPQALLIPTRQDTPQTPLCLALKNTTTNTKSPLIFKLMNGLSASIPCDGLYPFALAASQDCDLSLIYTLLLASPHVLSHMSPPPLTEDSGNDDYSNAGRN